MAYDSPVRKIQNVLLGHLRAGAAAGSAAHPAGPGGRRRPRPLGDDRLPGRLGRPHPALLLSPRAPDRTDQCVRPRGDAGGRRADPANPWTGRPQPLAWRPWTPRNLHSIRFAPWSSVRPSRATTGTTSTSTSKRRPSRPRACRSSSARAASGCARRPSASRSWSRPSSSSPAPAPAEPAVADDTLQRTLLLAQKFVDETKADAEAQAARIIAEAEAKARMMTDQAQSQASQIAAESEQRLRDEITRLEDSRTKLTHEVESMSRHLESERNRLRHGLGRHPAVGGRERAAGHHAGRRAPTPAQPEAGIERASDRRSPHSSAGARRAGPGRQPAGGGPAGGPGPAELGTGPSGDVTQMRPAGSPPGRPTPTPRFPCSRRERLAARCATRRDRGSAANGAVTRSADHRTARSGPTEPPVQAARTVSGRV